ncbi:MAG: ATP-binding protein, partial [Pseudomonadota bacterium]
IEDIFNNIQTDISYAAKSLGVKLDNNDKKIDNSEEYSLFLAARVKNIALHGSVQKEKQETQPNQIISNLMQNIHIIFGLSQCLYFSYEKQQQKLFCSAENINSTVDLEELNIQVDPPRSLLAKAFNKKTITSSFENKTITAAGIVDRYITRLLKTDGILCIPLLNSDNFFGVLVVGVSHERYPGLLEQRLLLGDFTRTAVKNLSQFKIQQQSLQQANEQQSLHIRKLIHEANNPLTIITNYLQILSMKMQDSDKNVGSQINTLQQEVERVANILLRMKESPDKNDNIMENTNINLLIQELVSVFETSLFHSNQIVADLRLDESIPSIQCDRNGLKQVVINLIKNAAEAISDGGIIEIETHDLINVNGQQYIELIITDTGPGISDDVLANLFKPVNTTKGKNHSGLGLSICKNIIDTMQAMISCHKQQSGGTRFVILLPRKIAKEISDDGTN